MYQCLHGAAADSRSDLATNGSGRPGPDTSLFAEVGSSSGTSTGTSNGNSRAGTSTTNGNSRAGTSTTNGNSRADTSTAIGKGRASTANGRKRSRGCRENVLGLALAQYPDYRIVVTGHSLGAGTATILAFLLRWGTSWLCWSGPLFVFLR